MTAIDWLTTKPPRVTVDQRTARFLALHEARAHAMGGRSVEDLGDAILLHDPGDDEPFWNRLSGIRLPEEPAAFDRRLDELIGRFRELGRQPHVWEGPLHDRPADLAARLEARGFVDLGRGLTMLLADPSRLAAPTDLPPRLTIERICRPPRAAREELAAEMADLLVAAFRVDPLARLALAADLQASFELAELSLCVARVDGLAVAVAKRATFDGASYLSSIGTRPGWQGRGLGTLVTVAAIRDGLREASRLTYLGVFDDNVRARALYERLGFATLGRSAGDYLLP
jgi:ribosomal protein S18 acetylase RimI-like enzyme